MVDKNRKHILVVAPYVTFPDEPGANRFISIVNLLAKEFDVTLVTSRFCHYLKSHRLNEPQISGVNIVLLDEPGYEHNVSFRRLQSHQEFCKNFNNFLKSYIKKIDIVYSAYPLIKTNLILGKNKEIKKYKLIIDIQDIWPEAIAGSIPLFSGLLGKLLLTPITMYANKAYSYADALVSVSRTYLNRANVKKLSGNDVEVIFIGSDRLFYADKIKKNIDINMYRNKKLLVSYIGTMSGSYDLFTVVKAAALCKKFIKFQFIGSGPDEKKLKALNEKLDAKVSFLGNHSYNDAMKILTQSDIAINPLKKTAMQSITNKLSDYFCSGLPIVSCQENQEVKELLQLGGGIQYQSGDYRQLSNILIEIAKKPECLSAMSEINRKIASDKFFRPTSYLAIRKLIYRLLQR